MEKAKYALEIYEPGSIYDVWTYLESPSPFLSISRGDFINPGTWTDTMHPKEVARVEGVEHIVFTSGDRVTHKVLVFTSLVSNTPEGKLAGL